VMRRPSPTEPPDIVYTDLYLKLKREKLQPIYSNQSYLIYRLPSGHAAAAKTAR
jgi:hypothetical protein